ncbi:hypothetical protein [Ideonella sp. YS5]|uniref:hypothetical protein n=1 Tax=Ideonella sp. YS5 TaxID=3453714 RepID=UPI003EEE777F
MEHIPECLTALGLGLEADERAIRRAYAQRLKRIDQAADPQAFQSLREAYEMALRWAAWQRQQADSGESQPPEETVTDAGEQPVMQDVPADTGPAESVRPQEPPPAPVQGPESIGEAVFAGFVARMDQPFKSEDEAQAALDQALADERLINLEARAFFEWRVACRLVEGWQPGHEFLLGPACTTFHWDTERRQLAVFGRVGAILNAAIDERLIFFRQPAGEFEAQRQLIQRLRRDAAPPPARLAEDMPRLRQLAQRYPHWLPIITPRAHASRWSESFDQLPASMRTQPPPGTDLRESVGSAPPKRSSSGGASFWWVGLLLFAVIRVVSGLGSESHSRPARDWQPPTYETRLPSSSTRAVPDFALPGETAPEGRQAPPWEAPRSASSPKVARVAVQPAAKPAPAPVPPPAPADLSRRQKEAEAALQKALQEARQAAQDSVTLSEPVRAGGAAP